MTRELLELVDCSVIVVDWSGGSGPPYPQAVANIRLVGAMTAYMINCIVVSLLILNLNVLYIFIDEVGREINDHFNYGHVTWYRNYSIKINILVTWLMLLHDVDSSLDSEISHPRAFVV
jgi:hypothetical protein